MLLLLAPALALGAVQQCTHYTANCSDTPQCMDLPDIMLSFPCAPDDEPGPNSTVLAYNYQCSGTDLDVEYHTEADCSGSVSAECQWEMGPNGLESPSGCHMPFVLGECKTLVTFMGQALSLKFTGSCPSSSDSGCMSSYSDAIAACDFENPDYSSYCSGACNSALTSVAAECTGAEFVEFKSGAEQSLAMCSGCMGHSLQLDSDCPGLQDLTGEEDGGSDILAMHAIACGGACYDRLTQASNDCDASNPDEAPMKNQSGALLKLCSGCWALMVNALDSCPGLAQLENPTGADYSRFCSGACKAAINSVSSGCDASQGETEGDFKSGADNLTAYCQPPVVLTLTADGDPSDYADTTAIAASIATAAGVDVSLVTIAVAPGSVVITATIVTPPTTTPDAVQSSLGAALPDAATATAALGITVQAAPTLAITPYPVPSPSPPPPSPPPSPQAPSPQAPPPSTDDGGLPTGAIVGIAVGGVVVLLLAVVVGILCMKKAKNTKAMSPKQ